MGASTPVILKVTTPAYGRVVIDTSDGHCYHADLSTLKAVYCFPQTFDDWQSVTIDSYGLGLIWTTRFEVHVDQVLGLADRKEIAARAS
jgi:hypothetical protein